MPLDPRLRAYARLQRLPWPRTYLGRFSLVAFLGVHLPLLGGLGYVALTAVPWSTAAPVLGTVLAATLLGTGATLALQRRLLAPLVLTSETLRAFVEDRTAPTLPTRFDGEAGQLMADTQEALTQLGDLLTFKDRLVAVAAHDARNALASVQIAHGEIREALARPGVDPTEIDGLADVAEQSAARLARLFDNLLTMARADLGELPLDVAPLDAVSLAHDVADAARLAADRKGVALSIHVEGPEASEPLAWTGDRAKLHQVLANLVHNAVKFTPTGGQVTLTVGPSDPLTFSVRDTGIGMPQDVLEAVSRPFTTAQRNGTEGERGSGLGLWICRTFVGLHGGTLRFESAVGSGTTCTVTLPCATSRPTADRARVGSLPGLS